MSDGRKYLRDGLPVLSGNGKTLSVEKSCYCDCCQCVNVAIQGVGIFTFRGDKTSPDCSWDYNYMVYDDYRETHLFYSYTLTKSGSSLRMVGVCSAWNFEETIFDGSVSCGSGYCSSPTTLHITNSLSGSSSYGIDWPSGVTVFPFENQKWKEMDSDLCVSIDYAGLNFLAHHTQGWIIYSDYATVTRYHWGVNPLGPSIFDGTSAAVTLGYIYATDQWAVQLHYRPDRSVLTQTETVNISGFPGTSSVSFSVATVNFTSVESAASCPRPYTYPMLYGSWAKLTFVQKNIAGWSDCNDQFVEGDVYNLTFLPAGDPDNLWGVDYYVGTSRSNGYIYLWRCPPGSYPDMGGWSFALVLGEYGLDGHCYCRTDYVGSLFSCDESQGSATTGPVMLRSNGDTDAPWGTAYFQLDLPEDDS
ncbi:MAG: hypothetical protein JEZ07_08990 [Phycisphaerae bacterium]|nr:hypothetical protein [Phycisphaerae bacterium]